MEAAGVPSFPTDIVWCKDLVAWPTKIGDIIEAEIGGAELAGFKDEVRKKRGIDVPNMEKNSLFIGYVMAQAWEAGKKSQTLEKLCTHILGYAATVREGERQPIKDAGN
jgi:hypothetical protein